MSVETIYVVSFDNVTVSAVQDLIAVKAGTGVRLELRRFSLSASGVTSAAEIRVRLKRLTGTVALGSGGTTPSIVAVSDLNTIASGSTVAANSTTQATGTSTTLATWNWNVLQDFLEVPPSMEERWECNVSEALVFDIIAAPASTVLSGFMVFREV